MLSSAVKFAVSATVRWMRVLTRLNLFSLFFDQFANIAFPPACVLPVWKHLPAPAPARSDTQTAFVVQKTSVTDAIAVIRTQKHD